MNVEDREMGSVKPEPFTHELLRQIRMDTGWVPHPSDWEFKLGRACYEAGVAAALRAAGEGRG